MKKPTLSVIVIAKNEAKLIGDCLRSVVNFADEIVLVDSGSTDKTPQIAKKFGAKVIYLPSEKLEFARWRNIGLRQAKGEWVFYLDADEKFTPELKKEVKQIIAAKGKMHSAFAVPRRNFLLGKELHWGGWWPDYVKRFFRKKHLEKWAGRLHEEPIFVGSLGKLKSPLIHIQPEVIGPMLEKSIRWSKIEAELLYDAGHPPVVWWRIVRMFLTTLFDRLFKKQGFRDGTEGWIESIYQAFHTALVYMQLWEIQKKR